MVTVHATAAQTPSLNANAPWTHRGKVVSEYVQEIGSCLVMSTATNTSGETTLPELQLYIKHIGISALRCNIRCLYVQNKKSTSMFTLQRTANLPKFEHFFNNYIRPELFTNKILSKIIARSILKDIVTVDASTCTS